METKKATKKGMGERIGERLMDFGRGPRNKNIERYPYLREITADFLKDTLFKFGKLIASH